MVETFLENIEEAYKALEDIIDKGSEAVPESSKDEWFKEWIKERMLILKPNRPRSRTWITERIPFILGSGYLVKVKPDVGDEMSFGKCLPLDVIDISSFTDTRFEEINVQVLLNYGFTRENDFYVPKHKVIGVNRVDGKAKVDPTRYGWTITEDLTENGTYEVSDISPHHFALLKNRQEFAESYKRYITKLLGLFEDPSLDIDVCHHGRPQDPIGAVSRMLFIKEKEGIGEVFIGDLDNLEFKIK
ncbi:MAG TPA: hypothetical protein VJB94_01880 [Candidatus Nanoarchaeia archaeon]|nr:hypothetical protein [Candidatus Nanoarchaeia archaeon]